MKITPIILCGGSGTRLWPISRKNHPKQFLNLIGDRSLFQQSVDRVIALENNDFKIEEILIVANENHRFLLLDQLNKIRINFPLQGVFGIFMLTERRCPHSVAQKLQALSLLIYVCRAPLLFT